MILIIMGHGNYATGLLSSLSMLTDTKNIIAVDFLDGMSDTDLEKKLKKVIKDDKYLIVCDLLGGTPYKEASKLSIENKNIKVVTGANIGGLIDTNFKLEKLSLEEAAKNLVEASIKGVQLIEIKKEEKKSSEGI